MILSWHILIRRHDNTKILEEFKKRKVEKAVLKLKIRVTRKRIKIDFILFVESYMTFHCIVRIACIGFPS